ncbi:HAD-IIB family hydrolase [Pseudoflavonifractor sp. MSJ-37]|nr:HAD-IIB family hydrolase [Pseudoflavonifractor sp. MSJ-37]
MALLGRFDGVLLVSDFDDTLYGSDFTVSAENVAALLAFQAEGGTFTVATGRARPAFARHWGEAPINAPVILSNGSALYDFRTGEMVCETFLPEPILTDLMELTFVVPELGLEAYHEDEIYLHNPNIITRNHLAKVGAAGEEKAIRDIPTPLSKVLIEHDRRAVLDRAKAYILDRWGDRYEAIFSNQVLLELTAKGSSKGGMVLELARRLGIDRDKIYCIGDNENDLPMLEVSAVPFAPSNCAPIVRDWGAQLVGSCDESCLAQVVERLGERYPEK